MKQKYQWIVMVGFLFAASGWAIVQFLKPAPSNPGSELTVDNPVFDAGKVLQKNEVKHVFRLRNRSKSKVRIKKIRSSCSCTAAVISDSRRTMNPGESLGIEMTYDTTGRFGEKQEHTYVETDSPGSQILRLTIQCFVTAPLVWSPREVDFGSVRRGTAAERVVTIREDTDEPLSNLEVVTDSEDIRYSLTKINAGNIQDWSHTGGYVLRVSIDPNTSVGFLNTKVAIESSNGKGPRIEIPVKAHVLGDLEPKPKALFFGALTKGDKKSVVFEIQRAANSSSQVLDVRSDHDAVIAEVVDRRDEGTIAAKVQVTCRPDKLESGRFTATLRVRTTSKDVPEIEVKALGLLSG